MRPKLTYANVMATLGVFIALGGVSYAALKLPKDSVGAKQLKKNAVTASKIKKNGVTAAKIKKSAVTGAKVKDASLTGADIQDGSLTGSDVNAPSMPFSQIVHRARATSTLALNNTFQAYPLDNPTYTQPANEDDGYVGAVDVTIPSTCLPPRSAQAFILVDAPNPAKPLPQDVGAIGAFADLGNGDVSGRIDIGTANADPGRFEPGTATTHTLTLVVSGNCNGGGSGIEATFGGVHVIGTH